MKIFLTAICLVTALLFAGTVFSDQATGNLNISANVPDWCSVSATAVNFGSYIGSQLDSTGAVIVTCTNGTAYIIDLDYGQNYSGGNRRMIDSTSTYFLVYDVYSDSNRTTRWDFAGGSGTGTGTAQSHTVYGRIPGGQLAGAGVGSYSDTIMITVNY